MLLAFLFIVPGCSSANDPEYARRISEYGTPDLISEQSPTGPRYYSAALASQRPPRPSEVYYYLNKNKEIYFRQGMAPMVVEIPPTLKDSLVNISRRVQQ